jgi:hypothetical protein
MQYHRFSTLTGISARLSVCHPRKCECGQMSVVMSAEGGRGRPLEGPSIICASLGFATNSTTCAFTHR